MAAHHQHHYPHFPHLQHGREQHDSHERDLHHWKPTQVLPDLRFETSYLKSIKRYVQVSEGEAGELEHRDEKEGMIAGPLLRDVEVQVEWGKVLWVTLRDQVISPFLQGALWGYASLFIRPIIASLRGRPTVRNVQEGKASGWLRNWLKATLGGVSTSFAGNGR
ncbi:hypothetical protein GLOTRDRAFT_112754 [Gloeophyllum trabeum ATCC 11539]|uniref:DUF1770-domain-containing protein n=1 Tax=Gloeophyllum trabeum (strain ATCC 11539 / FP-39264 / Madison 617) TaxID=670483 RepID=S7PRY5_GLOTA|nr:uncharacterized protein GLOTRDRAFT_112754 [Gloeophyllum trabeum ATCC 11539]EPQ50148.1 hypothetical protein GLOTRDRAFT_112754 [Gloeophyllum trabeum ATCC 11539]